MEMKIGVQQFIRNILVYLYIIFFIHISYH